MSIFNETEDKLESRIDFTENEHIIKMNFKDLLKEEIFKIMDEKIDEITQKIDIFKQEINLQMRSIKQINFNEPNHQNFKQEESVLWKDIDAFFNEEIDGDMQKSPSSTPTSSVAMTGT